VLEKAFRFDLTRSLLPKLK